MRALAAWLYHACVDVILNLCGWTGLTYRDVNTLVLLIGFPAITLGLLIAVGVRLARRTRQDQRERRRSSKPVSSNR